MATELSPFTPGDPDEPPSKQAILREALRLFVRDGLCETSLRDIASATGYSNTVLYKFFDSKDALAIHLFERCYDELVRGVSQALSPDHSFEEGLDALVKSYVRFLDRNLDAVLYVHENLRLYWPQVGEKTRALSLVGLLAAWIGKGKIEGAIDPGGTTGLLVTLTIGFLGQFARMLYFKECDPPAVRWQTEIKTLLLRSLVQKGEEKDGV